MTTFLIEVGSDGLPMEDFEYTVIDKIKRTNWYYNETMFQYNLIYPNFNYKIYKDDIHVPIGSVEFVLNFFEKYNIKLSPINIPDSLMEDKFLKRKVKTEYVYNDEIFKVNKFFKELKFKGFSGIIEAGQELKDYELPSGKYLMSEIVNIDSEYRIFIYKNNIIGCKHYLGDYTILPDFDLIKNMVLNYKDSPVAYTLDVGVEHWRGTFLIECHNFFSCGLYGFEHPSLLMMFVLSTMEIMGKQIKFDRNKSEILF